MDGALEFLGSGGNLEYSFRTGDRLYQVALNRVGTADTPWRELRIFKGETLLKALGSEE